MIKEIIFPGDDDVAVVGKAGWVAIREHELACLAGELARVDNGLEEQLVDGEIVAFRAGATVDAGVGKSDVRFEVVGFEIFAVPALWKEELEAKAVDAIGVNVGFVGQEVAVERGLGVSLVVEAVEANGLLAQGGLRDVGATPGHLGIGHRERKVALVWIARNHLEAVGHGAGKGVITVDEDRGVLVVGQVRDFGDHGQLALAVLEIESCRPVGRLVLGHLARRAGAA